MFLSGIYVSWKLYFQKQSKLQLIFSVIILLTGLICISNFLLYNEIRNGVTLDDPILKYVKPIELSYFTFFVIYSTLLFSLYILLYFPEKLIITLQAYSLLIVFRIIVMFSLPLNPPEGIIPLIDPFVELFGNGKPLMKDLFFSGHTSILFLLYLTAPSKRIKTLFLCSTIIVGTSVLLQHVHYFIDVIAAPFFSFASYKIVCFFHR